MPTFANDANGHTPLYYIAFTLTNNQSGTSATGMQAQVIVDSNTNSAKYGTTLLNVNWQDGSGNILDSWLESGETNTSTTSTYWVNLGSNQITGSGGTFIIYQVLYGTSQTSLDGTVTGAEPNYTGTYGQYDNGANVFSTLYQNFAGVSTPSGWTNSDATNIIQNDGLTFGATSNSSIITSGSYCNNITDIVEFKGNCGTATNNSRTIIGAGNYVNSWIGTSAAGLLVDGDTTVYFEIGGQGHDQAWNGGTITANTINIYSIWYSSTAGANFAYNYTNTGSSTFLVAAYPAGVFLNGTHQTGMTVTWFRVRTAPPSFVLPSTSAGSLTPISAPSSTLNNWF